MTTSSERVAATIPLGIYQYLKKVADKEQRPIGSLLNYIIEAWVRSEQEKELSINSGQSQSTANILNGIAFELAEIRNKLQQQNTNSSKSIHL